MSTTIRDVLVKITTDNTGLAQGLDAAKSTLKGFAVAAGAALGAATAAFAGVTMAAIKSSQEIERFAKVSNASTTEFQRWSAAAGTAGVATEKMADILKDVNFATPIAEIIRQHHERMDGSGYPRGLRGDEILPEARVLAVADVIESMAAHRPYRAALGLDVAMAEIDKNRGQLYDPEVANAMGRLVRQKNYQLPA